MMIKYNNEVLRLKINKSNDNNTINFDIFIRPRPNVKWSFKRFNNVITKEDNVLKQVETFKNELKKIQSLSSNFHNRFAGLFIEELLINYTNLKLEPSTFNEDQVDKIDFKRDGINYQLKTISGINSIDYFIYIKPFVYQKIKDKGVKLVIANIESDLLIFEDGDKLKLSDLRVGTSDKYDTNK